jgi:hypothetical protein
VVDEDVFAAAFWADEPVAFASLNHFTVPSAIEKTPPHANRQSVRLVLPPGEHALRRRLNRLNASTRSRPRVQRGHADDSAHEGFDDRESMTVCLLMLDRAVAAHPGLVRAGWESVHSEVRVEEALRVESFGQRR